MHEYSTRRVVAGLIFAMLGTGFLLEGMELFTINLVYVWPLLLIGVGVSVLLGRAQRIKVEEDRSAQLAVAEERVRIARELHDVVAHSVSLMTVQIAAARRVAAKRPEAAEQALAAAEQTGRHSLAELRGIVSVLRGADASIEAASQRGGAEGHPLDTTRAPLPGLDDLKPLVDGVREAGLDISFSTLGVQPEDVAPGTQLAVYRVVQEALTNVIRHADASSVEVAVLYLPGTIEVRVEDDGKGTGQATTPSRDGHGIMGMRERVAAVGGSVTAGRTPLGWRVQAEFPVDIDLAAAMTEVDG